MDPVALLIFSCSLVLTAGLTLAWLTVQNKVKHWSQHRVPYIPMISCFASILSFTFKRKAVFEVIHDQYTALEGQPFGGTFQIFEPSILLRDPVMVKTWLITEFSSFHDRIFFPATNGKSDKLSGNLFQLTGEKWRLLRRKLSPLFSSEKLRTMYEALEGCAGEFKTHLETCHASRGETELDIKELLKNYTTDVVGACMMGIRCDAMRDPDNCRITWLVQELFRYNWRLSMHQFLSMIHPRLPKLLGLSPRDSEIQNFLADFIKDAMRLKQGEGHARKDLLQLLMNSSDWEADVAKELGAADSACTEDEEDRISTEDVMIGVIGTSLAAGLQPTSDTVTFCAYELAHHPEVQEELFREIQMVKKISGGKIEYDSLKKLRYLDQVVKETLRKYPIVAVLGRKCTNTFKIPDTSVTLEKGTKVFISTMGFQHDPKFFPEPEKFAPERFSEENVNKIVSGSYLPFGDGPRSCLGMRLALMIVKSMIITLVSNYTLHPYANARNHLKADPYHFTLSPKGQVWLQFRKRRQTGKYTATNSG